MRNLEILEQHLAKTEAKPTIAESKNLSTVT